MQTTIQSNSKNCRTARRHGHSRNLKVGINTLRKKRDRMGKVSKMSRVGVSGLKSIIADVMTKHKENKLKDMLVTL